MNKKISSMAAVLGMLIAVQWSAQTIYAADSPETARVVETFACHYRDGKGASDLMAAADFWNQQLKKINSADLNNYFAAILTPFRATTEADFFWVGAYPNLNSMARGETAYQGSDAGQAADARFAAMSDCTTNTYFSEPLYEGLAAPDPNDDSALIEMYGCTLRHGKTLADAAKAEDFWRTQVTAMKTKARYIRWTPYFANTPFDLVYIGVNDNLQSFAANQTAYRTSSGGQQADNGFNEVMNCESGLMHSRVVHRPVAD